MHDTNSFKILLELYIEINDLALEFVGEFKSLKKKS